MAYVPQVQAAPFPFTVAEVVLMGRTPRLGVAGSPGRNDVLIAQENMARRPTSTWATRPGSCAIRALAAEGLATIMISHNPDHAFAVATTAALLHHETLQVGWPVDVVTAENLAVAYGAEIEILHGTVADGTAVTACVPLL